MSEYASEAYDKATMSETPEHLPSQQLVMQENKLSSPTLLGLPREVRDLIYSYFTSHTTRPPPRTTRYLSTGCYYPARVDYQTDYLIPRYPALAFVDLQLWREIKHSFNSPNITLRDEAELDLIVRGHVFHPTWLRIPGTVQRDQAIDLAVNLRIFGTESFFGSRGSRPRKLGPGFGLLFGLLNSFLLDGPSLGHLLPQDNLHDDKLPFCISTLCINVTFHDYYTPDTWPTTWRVISRVLCEVAGAGVLYPYVKRVKATVAYTRSNEWVRAEVDCPVPDECDLGKLEEWREAGYEFLSLEYELAL